MNEYNISVNDIPVNLDKIKKYELIKTKYILENKYKKVLKKDYENIYALVINGDSREVTKYINSNSIDLTITSPPYNIALNYPEYEDILKETEYIELLTNVFKETYRITKDGGILILHTRTDETKKNKVIIKTTEQMKTKTMYTMKNLSHLMYNIALKQGFKYYASVYEVIPISKYFYIKSLRRYRTQPYPTIQPTSNVYMIFYKNTLINTKNVCVSFDEKMVKNFTAITNSCLFQTTSRKSHKLNITLPRYKGQSPYSTFRDFITMFSCLGYTVFDPFSGVGTTGLASLETGRNYIGIELTSLPYNEQVNVLKQAAKKLKSMPNMYDVIEK